MAKFCTNCGKEIATTIAFCTECGMPAPAESPNSPEKTPVTVAAAPIQKATTPLESQPQQACKLQQQPSYEQPMDSHSTVMQDIRPKSGKYSVVGTGAFFGLMLLFAIPIIGWIACIVMAFASKNENIKHFACAMLIWLIIAAVLCVATYFLFAWIGNALKDYISEATGGQFGNWLDIFEQFRNGEYSSIPME